VALVVSAGVLWLVGAYPDDPALGTVLGQVIVLGMPAAVGAAAGRLAV
jgi:uncharacterized membrane protein